MKRYDYLTAIKNDILEYLADDENRFACYWAEDPADRADLADLEAGLYEELWTADSVTGNASGSYTFNAWQAEEYLAHNMGLLMEALAELSGDPVYVLQQGAEICDVTIRCYLLDDAISLALAEIRDHLAEIDK